MTVQAALLAVTLTCLCTLCRSDYLFGTIGTESVILPLVLLVLKHVYVSVELLL